MSNKSTAPAAETGRAQAQVTAKVYDHWPQARGLLERLVRENSFTTNGPGIEANVRIVEGEFSAMGFQARRLPSEDSRFSPHLILENQGRGPAILMVSHLDTVYTPSEQESGFREFEGTNGFLCGPGTMDIKGGTAMMWLMLRVLGEMPEVKQLDPRWILAWNSSEEQLSADFSKQVLNGLPDSTKACLVFEADNCKLDGQELITARKGLARWTVHVRGRGSHSGSAHEEGVNALAQLARIVLQLDALTDYGRALTVNVAIVHGGVATNRVPDAAMAEFEIRYRNFADYERLRSELFSWNQEGQFEGAAADRRCQVALRLTSEIQSWEGGSGTKDLVDVWQKAGHRCGLDVKTAARGGLSDANYFGPHLPTLDGLGPRGGNAHTIEDINGRPTITEYAEPASFLTKGLINVLALRSLLLGDG